MASELASRSQAAASSRSAPRWAVWVATGAGVGFLPVMPGTYGAAEGVCLFAGLAAAGSHWGATGSYKAWLLCAAVVLLTGLSLGIIALALPYFSSEDPSSVVLDEVAGQCLTLLPLAFVPGHAGIRWMALGAGFLLFRIFDTLKPYPIWPLGNFPGARGVLADDLGAGVAGAIVLFGVLHFTGW